MTSQTPLLVHHQQARHPLKKSPPGPPFLLGTHACARGRLVLAGGRGRPIRLGKGLEHLRVAEVVSVGPQGGGVSINPARP